MTETTADRRSSERRRAAGDRRGVHGVLLLDKPTGMSSNAALQQVKRMFRARKAGHTGSLDPIASGMLPICFGEATKMSAYLLGADKHYRVTGKLGAGTDTGDAEGAVTSTAAVPALDQPSIEAALKQFEGEQTQLPPMYSALKHRGERLYSLARRGVEVERKPRSIRIHRLALVEHSDDTLVLEVRCSKGTYVRTLFEDVAAALGTCGHVTALRRFGVGPYEPEGMVSMAELSGAAERGWRALDKHLLPVDSAVSLCPSLKLSATVAFYLRQGQAVTAPGGPPCGVVRLYDESGDFLGVGEMTGDGRVAPRRLLVS